MEKLQYLPRIDKRQHIMTLKDIFSYYDVKKITGKGNLRITYGRKDKRDLAVSIFNVYIAEMFDVFVQGGIVFNFPDKNTSKMLFKSMSKDIINKSKKAGKLKLLDPLASGFTGVKTVVSLASKNAFYDVSVYLSENFQKTIYNKLNSGKKLFGKKDKQWKDFMEPIYVTFADIDREALDKLVLFGLRKMTLFLSKGLELFFQNTKNKEHIYIGRCIDKHKDVNYRYRIMAKQYVKKLRWHWRYAPTPTQESYYAISEEFYTKHQAGELIPTVILKKIKEECLIGAPWYRYVMKTNTRSLGFTTLKKDHDSTNDELIFIKPQNAETNDQYLC